MKRTGALILLIVTFTAFAQELMFDHDDPVFSYGYKGEWYTKKDIQERLFFMTDNPREFQKIFEFFERFDSDIALNINYRSTDGENDTYLTYATASKHWGIVEYLIAKKISIDATDIHRATGLIWAAYCGHYPSVESLVKANANLTLIDKQGDTALSAAIRGKQENACSDGQYDKVIEYLSNEQQPFVEMANHI